jgi:uncharacterized membrane protein YhhN
MIVLAAVCLVACGALVFAEWKHLPRMRITAKVVASLAFLALGIVACLGWAQASAFGAWIVAGLALGVIGDIALLGKSERAFLVGLGAFLLGHIAYIVAIATQLSPREWLPYASLPAIIPPSVALVVVIRLWPRLGSMRGPVIAYAFVISTMVIAALALWHVPDAPTLPAPQARLMATLVPGYSRAHEILLAGACLFFASDLSVARDKFVGASFTNKLWGLPAYYAGQLLIAWSLAS